MIICLSVCAISVPILTNQCHDSFRPNTALSVCTVLEYALNFATCFGNYCIRMA